VRAVLSVDQAIDALLAGAGCRAGQEEIALIDGAGRILARRIEAPIDVPPADNSAMDGYAIRFADLEDVGESLPISQRITAGTVPGPLAAGTAARIFTGAEIPQGADTVVMQEHCEEGEGMLRVLQAPRPGANIRPRGQDIEAGQRILSEGLCLRSQDLGLAASLGIARIPVYRRLRVAVLSTGDELCEPGDEIRPGQIYNSNRYIMQAQLSAWGFEVMDFGIARDDPAVVRESLQQAAGQADVVLTSGGVSVGEEDHVKSVVESLGSLDLWRIAIKPGKPFAFGQIGGTPFIGLPGNPVSVFVTLLVIARPFLFACQGNAALELRPVRQRALFAKKGSPREDYLRVRQVDGGVELFPNQSSGVLYSTSWGDGLVRQPADLEIREGDAVDYLPWPLFG
jgi:molybdopterin molybdotransferase